MSSYTSDGNISYRIRFKPSLDIFLTGTDPDPLLLLEEIRSLGKCKVIAQIDNIPPLDKMNPEYCHIYWDMILTTNQGIDTIIVDVPKISKNAELAEAIFG